jgi:hypothetical protein
VFFAVIRCGGLGKTPVLPYILGMTTVSPVTIAPSAVKSTLARLLSTESIAVIHDPGISTAFFDLKARSLHLPMWKDVTNSLYDMLVGHEVAHALWTAADDWRTGIETVQARTGVSRDTAAGTLNVVEDARIERMIKDKFPGLRRDFHSGYGTLHTRGFFGDLSNISRLGFADRVNLHFKIGLHIGTPVPFSAAEAAVVSTVDAATTWSHVVEAAVAIITHAQITQQQQTANKSDTDAGQETDGGEDGTEAETDAAQGGERGTEDGTKKDQSTTEDIGDAGGDMGSQGDTEAEGEAEAQTDTASSGSVNSTTWGSDPGAPVTDSALERAIREQLVDTTAKNTSNPVYTTVVGENGIQCPAWRVVDFPAVMERMSRLEDAERHELKTSTNPADGVCVNRLLTAMSTPVRSRFHTEAANSMFTAFDRRKAADVFRRSRISNSGALDPLRMNQYRWNEDIFRKNIRVAEGKNHGIVIALDWSGSMGGIMRETIGQLFIITDFCRRAGIPFEVYSFSDVEWDGSGTQCGNQYADMGNSEIRAVASVLTLANWLSSRMTKPQYERMKTVLSAFPFWNYSKYASGLGLGSTPTHAATFALIPVVQQFVSRNRIQIPHVMFLTDGEPSDTIDFYPTNRTGGWHNSTNVVMRDSATGVAYSLVRSDSDEDTRAVDCAYNTCPDTSYMSLPAAPRWGGASRLAWIGRDILRRRTGAAVHWLGLCTNEKQPRMCGFTPSNDSDYKRNGYARGIAAGWDSAVVARAGDFSRLTNDADQADAGDARRAQRFDDLLDSGMKGAKRTASGGFSAAAVKSIAGAMAVRNSAKSVASVIGELVAV